MLIDVLQQVLTMKMRFVCEPYRQEMLSNKTLAIHCWQDSFDTGLYLFEQMHWFEALPHLGRAFVASEIILSSHALSEESATEMFTASSLALISTLANLGNKNGCVEIYNTSRIRLKQLALNHKELSFWLDKFDEQVKAHSLHPGLLDQFTGMTIANREIMPVHSTVH